MESLSPSPSHSLRNSHASPVPKDSRQSLAAPRSLGKALTRQAARVAQEVRTDGTGSTRALVRPVIPRKMEHSPFRPQRECGGTFDRSGRGDAGAATGIRDARNRVTGIAPLGVPPPRLRATAEPMPERAEYHRGQSGYRVQVRGGR